MTGAQEIAAKTCKDTTLYMDATGAKVFFTESGALGMEYQGRIVIKTIESWIALAWGDLDRTACEPRREDGYR